MSPLQKPEWIEISDADKSASIRGISKGLPVMALVAVAAILGIGSIFAQTAEQSPASAIEIAAHKSCSESVACTNRINNVY